MSLFSHGGCDKRKMSPSYHRTTRSLSRDKEMVKGGEMGMGGEFSVGVDAWKKTQDIIIIPLPFM